MFARLCTLPMLLVLLAGTAYADPSPSPAAQVPTPGPTDFPFCPLEIEDVERLTSDAQDVTYAAALRADGDEGKASGSLTLYVGDLRYEVPFREVTVAGWSQSLNTSMPIVFQLPPNLQINDAYVASLDSPTPGSCGVGNLWTTRPRRSEPLVGVRVAPPFDRERFKKLAQTIAPTPAVLAALEPHPSCKTPYQNPKTLDAKQPDYPLISREESIGGTYEVAVIINPAGSIVDANIYAATNSDRNLASAAIQAALGSTYQAEIFRCAPVYGTYLFRADFIPR